MQTFLSSNSSEVSAKEIAQIVIELRHQYALAGLLKAAGMTLSTFYYQHKALQVGDKYADVKARIRAIYDQYTGRYGYRRITAMLRCVRLLGVRFRQSQYPLVETLSVSHKARTGRSA